MAKPLRYRGRAMKLSYRKRRDQALKKFSETDILNILTTVTIRSGIPLVYKIGRPCRIKKAYLIAFILDRRLMGSVYEQMETESSLYLGMHYDHSAFHYHYSRLSPAVFLRLTNQFCNMICNLLQDLILLHIFDSTALSTSVREERTVQGLRKKERLTQKFHTLLGYDPPNQIVVVEAMLATDHHTSDNQGALRMMRIDLRGYAFGDTAYETYDLIEATENAGLVPVYKPSKKPLGRPLTPKGRRRNLWDGNPNRLYKEIRGTGEVLYGAATRCGLIRTESKREENRLKDALLIGLRQNLLTYIRLKALSRIIRKTRLHRYL